MYLTKVIVDAFNWNLSKTINILIMSIFSSLVLEAVIIILVK